MKIPAGIGHGAAYLPDLEAILDGIVDDLNLLGSGTGLLSGAGLAIGTDKTKVAHDAFTVTFDGAAERVAAGEVAFTATTHDIADPDADPREAIYVLSVAQGGAVTITKGADAAEDAAEAPATPAGEVKLGEVKVQHDGTAIFDATTNELDAAHLTATFTSSDPALKTLRSDS